MEKIKRTGILVMAVLLVLCLCQSAIAAGKHVNINKADQKELVTLKYVGEKTARKIIEYRKLHLFEKPEDIMKVKGIGKRVFDANKDIIVVKDDESK
jgi:competence protein ComEA